MSTTRHADHDRRSRSAALRSRRAVGIARLRRRKERQAARRLPRPPGRFRQVDADRRVRHRQGLPRADREDDGESVPARRSADDAVVGLHEPVADVDAEAARRADGRHRRAGQGRQALQARGLGGARAVRLHQAVVSDRRALAAEGGRRRRRAHARSAEEGRVLHPPVHRRAGAVEFRADQSGSLPRDDRHRRQEPGQGPAQPARRHRARQRPAQDLDDRSEGVRARRQHRAPRRARSCSRTT